MILMAYTAHRAVAAFAAAGRPSSFFISDHAFDDQSDDQEQGQTDNDRSDVFR